MSMTLNKLCELCSLTQSELIHKMDSPINRLENDVSLESNTPQNRFFGIDLQRKHEIRIHIVMLNNLKLIQ